jgi:hypothetical protein
MRVALLVFLLSPIAAHAGPETWAAIALWVTTNAVVIAQVAIVVGSAVYGAAQQRKAARRARDDYNAKLQDRTITRVATEAPFRTVYGRARVGSDIVALFKGGDKDQYKYLVCVHAAHECDAIEQVYIAGKLVPLNANGEADYGGQDGDYFKTTTEHTSDSRSGQTFDLTYLPIPGSVTLYANGGSGDDQPYISSVSGKTVSLGANYGKVTCAYQYRKSTSMVTVKTHLGGPTDPADAMLLAEVPDKWTASAVLRGFCYTVVKLDLNQPEFQGGIPTIEVVLRGKKLYDYRTGTTAWSRNVALAIYDYLTGEMCGVDAADLPMAQFIAAANVCGEWPQFAGVTRYAINGTVTSDEAQPQVLERMAQAMAGGIVSTTWDIYAGKYTAPVKALDQSDIVGSIAITPGISDADLYNGVKGQYVGPEIQWVAQDFTPYRNATYVAADGKEKWTNIDFSFTDEVQRIHNLCRIFTEDQRNGLTVRAEFSLKAWPVKVGQRITLTSAFFGWSAKVFRIMDRKPNPAGMVELTMKEDDPSIWDAADAVLVDATPNTGLPNPFYIAPMPPLSCTSGTDVLLAASDGSVVSRILVQWAAESAVNTQIEVEWTPANLQAWQRTNVEGDTGSAYCAPVQDGQLYVVRARRTNPYLGTRSDWVYVYHTVIGQTAPPADVPWFLIENNTMSWGAVGDADIAGYRIKFHYGLNRSWGDAHDLHAGVLTQNPFTPEALPQGQLTLMIKAVDRVGNESPNFPVIQTQFGDVLVHNVVETFDFQAGGYQGSVTGGTVGGTLQALGIAVFFKGDTARFFSQFDSAPFLVDNYAQMVYETPIITPSKAAVGSQMTFQASITGEAQFIEYRVSGAKAFYSLLNTEAFFVDGAFFEPEPTYQPWPGQIGAKNIQYQFRISTGQSATQGVIDACKVVIDVPDVMESLNDIVIGAGGTRLPIVRAYNVIQNVQLTLQADGGSAFKVEVADKNPTLGPLIYCRDSSGAPTIGKVDADLQGY